MMSFGARRIVVVKLGGSVLTSSAAYRPAAQFLAKRIHGSPEEQIVAVVSAQEGLTDTLERVARDIQRERNAATLDLLWHTGGNGQSLCTCRFFEIRRIASIRASMRVFMK